MTSPSLVTNPSVCMNCIGDVRACLRARHQGAVVTPTPPNRCRWRLLEPQQRLYHSLPRLDGRPGLRGHGGTGRPLHRPSAGN